MPAKRPKFGHPRGTGSPFGNQPIPETRQSLDVGARVSLWYKKRTVVVRIDKIGPEHTFEGAIESFDPPAEQFKDLSIGESVRFRRDNIRWVH